jgi:DNA processing protein
VVSGGAIGCDQAAHGGALEIGGRTVVVLGCGADVVYPARAAAIFSQALAEGGAIISEAPWGSSPSRWGFRRRNRLIAGIAQATLIVEAGLPSGTFSTADAALAQGKEVLAVPGSIFARESRGANRLISQGAVPIVDDESFEDVLTQIFGPVPYSCAPFLSAGASVTDAASSAPVALRDDAREGASTASPGSAPGGASPGSAPGGTAPVASTPAQDSVQVKALEALAQHPLRPEELLGVCGDDVVEVIRCLTSLELTGCVTRLRDGRYANGF